MDADLPDRIEVFAIEVEDVETIHEGCTALVEQSIEPAAREIARLLNDER